MSAKSMIASSPRKRVTIQRAFASSNTLRIRAERSGDRICFGSIQEIIGGLPSRGKARGDRAIGSRRVPPALLRGERQADGEAGALAGLALEGDGAAVGLDDLAG